MAFKKVAAAAALAAPLASAQVTGNDILVFALNLECLEAEFYSCAVDGVGLSEELKGGGPDSIGCEAAKLSPLSKSLPYGAEGLAKELKEDEVAHVRFLREALGEAAPPCPLMDISAKTFNTAATAAARAALGDDTLELDPPFNPYANDLFFLHGSFIFEDVGVTGYNGAVPAATILLPPGVVQAAASILGVEAYHSGAVRDRLLVADEYTQPAAAYNLTVTQIVQAISDLRDAVDNVGGAEADQDQGIMLDGMPNVTPTDENALVYARSVAQVLKIVYLGAEEKGGFFPKGVNGLFGEVTFEELLAAEKALTEQVENAELCNAPAPAPPMQKEDGKKHDKKKGGKKHNKKKHDKKKHDKKEDDDKHDKKEDDDKHDKKKDDDKHDKKKDDDKHDKKKDDDKHDKKEDDDKHDKKKHDEKKHDDKHDDKHDKKEDDDKHDKHH